MISSRGRQHDFLVGSAIMISSRRRHHDFVVGSAIMMNVSKDSVKGDPTLRSGLRILKVGAPFLTLFH